MRPRRRRRRVAIEQVLRSPPDGYTLLCSYAARPIASRIWCSRSRASILGRLNPSACSRPIRSSSSPGPGSAGERPQAEFNRLRQGQSRQGRPTVNQGVANTGHLLGALMELKGGYKMTPVFYRGSAPAINDLLAGTIDMAPDYLLANKPNIDAGKLKIDRGRRSISG